MIKVRITMYPHGNLDEPDEIGELEVVNTVDHPQRPLMGNYRITARFDGHPSRVVRIKNHVRSHGIVPLLRQALEMLEEE